MFKKIHLLLIFVLLLGFFLRVYKIDTNPPEVYADEMSNGYNAWSIMRTGTDEYGTPFPIQFRSFDDYKPPLPVYILIPFIKIFGLNALAIRLPVVLLSTLTIFLVFLLVKKLANEKVALIASILIAINPWHIHLSRGLFETSLGLSFLVSAIYFFVSAKFKPKQLVLSSVFFVATLYTYFSYRIMLIFFIPLLMFWAKDWIGQQKKYLALFIITLCLLSLPLVKLTFFDNSFSRLSMILDERHANIIKNVNLDRSQLSTTNDMIKTVFHNKIIYWARDIVYDYFDHFSVSFLYLFGDNSLRYSIGGMGLFYLVEFPFLLFGAHALFVTHKKAFWLVIIWVITAPIPAAIASHPFPTRSMALLPPILIFTAAGFYYVLIAMKRSLAVHISVRVLIVLLLSLSFSYWFTRYMYEYPAFAASQWDWESNTAVQLALKEENNYDYIFISDNYFDVDLALVYYGQIDPKIYREAQKNPVQMADGKQFVKIGKFYIGSLDINEERANLNIIPPKSLYIGRPEEVIGQEVILHPGDGTVVFKIHKT